MSVFKHTTFNPRWWAINGHVHTVASSFSSVKPVEVERVEIDTPDGDFLEIDIHDTHNDLPIVALFHGLEGNSERFYIRNLMHDLDAIGLSTIALNFRGCGSRINAQKRFYHSGETSDVKLLFDWMTESFPNRKIYAVGFSLGANILIKSLGELKYTHPAHKAVAVSPPYDLRLGCLNLEHGFNKLYNTRFIKTLSKKLAEKRLQFPDLPHFTGNTLYQFDDQITAPVHGFDDADDYYEQCSSKHFFKHVKKSLLLIHSKEDTICPLKYAPFQDIKDNPNIEAIFTKKGGHVGFISSPKNWVNETIISWLQS